MFLLRIPLSFRDPRGLVLPVGRIDIVRVLAVSYRAALGRSRTASRTHLAEADPLRRRGRGALEENKLAARRDDLPPGRNRAAQQTGKGVYLAVNHLVTI